MPGYCLQLDANGTWALTAAETTLASGAVGAAVGGRVGRDSFDPSVAHRLEVAAAGSAISASVDGVTLAEVADTRFAGGSAAIGGGWHPLFFDDLAVRSSGGLLGD